jgi:histidinol phosphatase-like enzyme
VPDAQINAIRRLLELHGRLPKPEELRKLGPGDPRYFGPDAQFRYERALEPPAEAEGFTAVEERPFRRDPSDQTGRAILLELDGVLVESASGTNPVLDPADLVMPARHRDLLARRRDEGWILFAHAWRPAVSRNPAAAAAVDRCFARVRELLGLEIDLGYCPHPVGPPICWCRKPLPGLVLEFAARRGVAIERCLVVGRRPAERTLAERLGATYRDGAEFFADGA